MRISWMEPNVLAAGGIPIGTKDIRSLHEQGIRAIVTLTEHPLTTQKEITSSLFEELEIIAIHAGIEDGHPPDAPTMRDIIDFLKRMTSQNRAAYVHCHAGVGRTGTVLHGYYLAAGQTLDEAKQKVKALRPTSGFIMLSDSQRQFLTDFSNLGI